MGPKREDDECVGGPEGSQLLLHLTLPSVNWENRVRGPEYSGMWHMEVLSSGQCPKEGLELA